MNPLSSRQTCAAVKVVGCIVAIFLLAVTLWIPYMSVAISAAFVISLLWVNRSKLPINNFQASIVGLSTGVMPLACSVLYPLISSMKDKDGELSGVVAANFLSFAVGGLISLFIVFFIFFVKSLFDHFMKECSDNKKSDVSTTNDPGSPKTDTDGMAT